MPAIIICSLYLLLSSNVSVLFTTVTKLMWPTFVFLSSSFPCKSIFLGSLCGPFSCMSIVVPVLYAVRCHVWVLLSQFSMRFVLMYEYCCPSSLCGSFSSKSIFLGSLCGPFSCTSTVVPVLHVVRSHATALLSLILHAILSHLRVLSRFLYAVRSHVPVCSAFTRTSTDTALSCHTTYVPSYAPKCPHFHVATVYAPPSDPHCLDYSDLANCRRWTWANYRRRCLLMSQAGLINRVRGSLPLTDAFKRKWTRISL
jgi:hypothetical protein